MTFKIQMPKGAKPVVYKRNPPRFSLNPAADAYEQAISQLRSNTESQQKAPSASQGSTTPKNQDQS